MGNPIRDTPMGTRPKKFLAESKEVETSLERLFLGFIPLKWKTASTVCRIKNRKIGLQQDQWGRGTFKSINQKWKTASTVCRIKNRKIGLQQDQWGQRDIFIPWRQSRQRGVRKYDDNFHCSSKNLKAKKDNVNNFLESLSITILAHRRLRFQ